MDEKIQGLLSDLFGIKEDSAIGEIIDYGLSAAPILAKLYNAFKLRRFKKRLDEHESQLNNIRQKLITLDEPLKEMVQNTIFPYVLDDLIEEHQEMKIEFILNGFEYIVDQEIREEDNIISYYDVLRDLRIEDIKRLLELTPDFYEDVGKDILEERRRKSDLAQKLIDNYEENKEFIDRVFDEVSYRKHIDVKLESKGLIRMDNVNHNDALLKLFDSIDRLNKRSFDTQYDNDSALTIDISKSKSKINRGIRLSPFGIMFIRTFKLKAFLSEIE